MLGKVTKRTVDALNPGERDVFLWDSELRGFGEMTQPPLGRAGGERRRLPNWRTAT